MTKTMKRLHSVLLVAILIGCVPAPYEQKIEGQILNGEKGAEGIKIRFLSKYPENTCEGDGLETVTDKDGKFKISQTYIPSKKEKHAVVTHPYRLCYFADERWLTAWKHKTGPAPHNIAFRCYMDESNKRIEKCLVSRDKQEFK
ncbi:MAG: hypothetical protein A2X59_09165 [Nitrospirae bacterium GWC2_42_7]|nr:MAG: hypothetical protein A2X59_09165 [Nitrospirae bacterium GWC2_42_7]